MNRNIKSAVSRAVRFGLVTLALTGWVVWHSPVAAASPAAGTVIGNQASATYTDSSGTQRQATSNVAETTVQQVGALTLTADNNRFASPGGQVSLPHILTNTGNGNDTFGLSVTNLTGTFTFGTITVYPDANFDGVPDSLTPISSSGPLAPGAAFGFVIVAAVPPSATSGESDQLQVTVTSVFDPSKTGVNTDSATVNNQGVISVTKASSLSAANPGATNTYTLTYINTGNNTVTNLVVTDDIPAGLTYVASSGRWSVSGATPLTDLAAAADPAGISYDFNDTLPNTVRAAIASVAPGATAQITFQVVVNTGLPPQTLNNKAQFTYFDGSGGPVTGPVDSNTTTLQVNQIAAVVFDDNPLQSGDTTLDDTVTVTNATQGSTVVFNNRVHNTGSGIDSFNITISSNSFPVGTTFQLYQSDGNTPLVDSTGDGLPDTGPVSAGTTNTVVLKATLPPSATGGPYTATLTATSTVPGSTVSDTVTDRLTAITPNTVDLTNNGPLPGGLGSGTGPEASAVVTNSTNPGTTTRFTLYVNNTSASADSFNLAASTNSTFASLAVPAGWSVVFKDSTEAVIGNTGAIAAGGNQLVYVDVTVPANAAPINVELYFRAVSPTTSSSDRIHDRVTINTIHALSNTPNNNGQTTAGGVVFYSHDVCNNGNVAESVTITATNSVGAWTSQLYLDSNSNGVYNAGDALIVGAVNIPAGTCVKIFDKITAPVAAPVNSQDVATITVNNGSGLTAVSTDTTTVAPNDLAIVKRQGIDTNCTGTISGSFATTPLSSGATPGACVRYQITATNNGLQPVNSVHVYDSTPAYTTYNNAVPASVTGGTVNTLTGPANNTSGAFDFNVGTLAPGASAVCTFGVRINP